jgi:hypothetical protein
MSRQFAGRLGHLQQKILEFLLRLMSFGDLLLE